MGGDLRLRYRRRYGDGHAPRIDFAGAIVLRHQSGLQHGLLDPRIADAVRGRRGGDRRRLRQLLRAADDRRRGHGVSEAERRQLVVRAAGRVRDAAEPAAGRLSDRVDRLGPAVGDGYAWPGPLLSWCPFARPVVAVDSDQHHRHHALYAHPGPDAAALAGLRLVDAGDLGAQPDLGAGHWRGDGYGPARPDRSHELLRSDEHTSELQSLMRISYAVFCLNKKKNTN